MLIAEVRIVEQEHKVEHKVEHMVAAAVRILVAVVHHNLQVQRQELRHKQDMQDKQAVPQVP